MRERRCRMTTTRNDIAEARATALLLRNSAQVCTSEQGSLKVQLTRAADALDGMMLLAMRGLDRDPADEIRRLQKLSALLACLQHAVNYDVSEDLQVDVSDALAAVLLLVDHEIDSLDELATPEVSP